MNNGLPIDISSINEKVYDFIKSRLLDLTYPPGERIDVRGLQAELGVSHTPIKDALFRLTGEGLVQVSPRRGTFATQVSERDIHEIYETRIIIETGAVEPAIARATDRDIDHLRSLFEATLEPTDRASYPEFISRDSRFHRAIVGFTGNRRLVATYERLNAHSQIIRYLYAPESQSRLPDTDQAHRAVMEAFARRDAEAAALALKSHLRSARDAIIGYRGQHNKSDGASAIAAEPKPRRHSYS